MTHHTKEASNQTTDLTRAEGEDAPLLLTDPLGGAAGSGVSRVRAPQKLVVAGLILAGSAAAILTMRHFGLGSPAGALAGLTFEYTPILGVGEAPKRVLSDLERSRVALQVPQELIDQDPFVLESGVAADVPLDSGPSADAIAHAARTREEQLRLEREEAAREAVRSEFESLHLQGVMGGSVPVARISGQTVRVGSGIGEHFVVESISGREVVLRAGEATFTLTMSVGEPSRGKKP